MNTSQMHMAAKAGNVALIKALFDAGHAIDLKNAQGDTPLHCAAALGNPKVVAQLLALGAHDSIPNKKGLLPLDIAANNANASMQKYQSAVVLTRHKQDTLRKFFMGTRNAALSILEELKTGKHNVTDDQLRATGQVVKQYMKGMYRSHRHVHKRDGVHLPKRFPLENWRAIGSKINTIGGNEFYGYVMQCLSWLSRNIKRRDYVMVLEADSLRPGTPATSTMWLGHLLIQTLGTPIGYIMTQKNYHCNSGTSFELQYLLRGKTKKKNHNLVYFDDGWYSGTQASILMGCINQAASHILAQNKTRRIDIHVWGAAAFATDKAEKKILKEAYQTHSIIPHLYVSRRIHVFRNMFPNLPPYLRRLAMENQTMAIPAHKTPNFTSLLFSPQFNKARGSKPAVYKQLLIPRSLPKKQKFRF